MLLAGKQEGICPFLTRGIQSQQVSFPWAFLDILAGTCTPELLGERLGSRQREGTGQHVACLRSGWGLAGPRAPPLGKHCWSLARNLQEGTALDLPAPIALGTSDLRAP